LRTTAQNGLRLVLFVFAVVSAALVGTDLVRLLRR
jgi:hypothetical protein